MKPMPDLTDSEAMLRRGKISSLASARNDALETLRDCVTRLNGADLFRDDVSSLIGEARASIQRIEDVQKAIGEL